MKKTLLFIFSLLTLSLWAQDGINYQGAATDANGDELTNQSISIRASVLSTTANGNLEWEETHSTTTDQFGLFNVVIGQGTNTTNGATTNFDDMDWGSGNHFLKIEMDATGGTNYAMIGTTQMMSVPYALYAKSAGIDSTMLANMIGSSGGGMGGDGCNFTFPDGLDGDAITINLLNSSYTVPTGKNLYVTDGFKSGSLAHIKVDGEEAFSIDGTYLDGKRGGVFIIKSGAIVEPDATNSNLILTISGFLVDQVIDPITINLLNSSYTVPAGKKLYITNGFRGGSIANIILDGEYVFSINDAHLRYMSTTPFMVNSGGILEPDAANSNTILTISGYLADENYFAGCGGGGGSSSTSNQISNSYSPISSSASPYNPLLGDYHVFDINYPTVNHIIVPSGKHFRSTYSTVNNCDSFVVYRGSESYSFTSVSVIEKMILVENDSIVFNYNNGGNPLFTMVGKLYDIDPVIEPFIFILNEGETYTVPSGKTAIATNITGSCIFCEYNDGSINMTNLSEGNLNTYFPTWKENTQITITPSGGCNSGTGFLYGYGWYVND